MQSSDRGSDSAAMQRSERSDSKQRSNSNRSDGIISPLTSSLDLERRSGSVDTSSVELGRVSGGSEKSKKRRDTISAISFNSAPAVLSWSHVTVSTTVGNNKKTLLNDITGSVTGGFWAIMGASGGGKTTLLNMLSMRYDPAKFVVVGDITLNGRPYTRHNLKAMSGYVMQDDLLRAELTVAETLYYRALLHLPASTTPEEFENRRKSVLDLMGISHVVDVKIGDTVNKGISGGERKRVCIAMELLSGPSLLFLDEPTSGLDSVTSLRVCSSLKELTAQGHCTAICTIHQPQEKIFNLFDNLILMKAGKIIYLGATKKVIPYLERHLKPCPPDVNPADHVLACLNHLPENEGENLNGFGALTLPDKVDLEMGRHLNFDDNWHHRGYFDQIAILTRRNWLQHFRNYRIILMNLICVVVLSIFISCGAWRQIGNDQDSQKLREPSLFFACVTQGIVASLQSVFAFPLERALLLRESAAGSYGKSSYFIARSIADLSIQIIAPILFSIIVYPTIGYQNRADKFFIYMTFMVLDTMAATSIATLVSCVCVYIELSTVAMSIIFEIGRLYGGFFIKPEQMVDYPEWQFAYELSYLKYAYVGVAVNEYTGLELTCTAQEFSTGKCFYQTGEQIMALQGYDAYSVGYCAGILVVYIFCTRSCAYLALRYLKY